MTRHSLLLRLEPSCEIVERDVQYRCQLRERAEAARLAAGFDLAQIARRDAGGSGKRLPAETTVSAPHPDRMLTRAEAADQFDRQIIGARLFLAEGGLPRLSGCDRSQVLGVLEALDQRLRFRAGERHGLAGIAHRYTSRRWATVSRTTGSASRSTRQMPRQSPWRRRTRCWYPRSGVAPPCTANGAAAKASALLSRASRSRLGIRAIAFEAAAETISFIAAFLLVALPPSMTSVADSDREFGPRSRNRRSILARADEVIK